MATIDWPSHLGRSFGVRRMSFGGRVSKSGWVGFFDGQSQEVSHLADRLTCSIVLPACDAQEAAVREAYFMEVLEQGHWIRLWHMQREEPYGTMRGTPTVAADATRGAREIAITTLAGRTLEGGDPIGIDGQLLFAGWEGAVADGAGLLTLPLMWPLLFDIEAGDAVTWNRPTTTFQMPGSQFEALYGRGAWQAELELRFTQAITDA